MLLFRRSYFSFFVLLFIIEVLIALFVNDRLISPYVGDFLVVILIYCFIRSFFNLPVMVIAATVLLFACAVETAQYFNFARLLGLHNNGFPKIILGNSFEWLDVSIYALGVVVVLIIEQCLKQNNR